MTIEDNIKQFTEGLKWFSGEMSNKLQKNSHKGDWRKKNVQELVKLMKMEVYELDDALEASDLKPDDIIEECIDISNFCLFIADVMQTQRKTYEEFRLYQELKARAESGAFDQFIQPEPSEFVDDASSYKEM